MASDSLIKNLSQQDIINAYHLGTGYTGGKGHNSISAMGTGSLFGTIAAVTISAFVLLVLFRAYADIKNGGNQSDFITSLIIASILFICFILFIGVFYAF